MRLRGTGNTPPGVDQCPKGLIFDALPDQAAALIEKGWAEAVNPEDDLGRTRLQMANAAVRGDHPTHPWDLDAADEWQGAGWNPSEGRDPYPAVQTQDVDTNMSQQELLDQAAGGGIAGRVGSVSSNDVLPGELGGHEERVQERSRAAASAQREAEAAEAQRVQEADAQRAQEAGAGGSTAPSSGTGAPGAPAQKGQQPGSTPPPAKS